MLQNFSQNTFAFGLNIKEMFSCVAKFIREYSPKSSRTVSVNEKYFPENMNLNVLLFWLPQMINESEKSMKIGTVKS